MPALYTITTRASGTILTAAMYNADHQNHVNNGDASHLGAFSANTSQMRTQTSPGDVGSESLALSISDELARIRYMIALMRGTTFWYGTATTYPGSINYFRNSDFLTLSRQGQTNKTYTASAGQPYTADRWYVNNGANQSFIAGPFSPLPGVKALQSFFVQRVAGQTGVTQMWIGQPFTLAQLAPLAGTQVTFSIYVLALANFTAPLIGIALYYGTGAGASKVSGMTGAALVLSQSVSTSIGTVTRLSATGTIPANATQLDALIQWTPAGTASTTDAIAVCGAKLEPGGQATPYLAPDPYAELAELQAFYWKSFQLGVTPASNTGTSGSSIITQVVAAGLAQAGYNLRWASRMIKAPTVTLFNPSAANAQARNVSIAADCTATTSGIIDESGCILSFSAAAASATGQYNAVHLTAEAEV